MKDWKTTFGGILVGIGGPLAAYGEGYFKMIGTIFASVGAVLLGYKATQRTQ